MSINKDPVKPRLLSRRQFIASCLVGAPAAALGNAIWIEPSWLRIRQFKLTQGVPRHRFVHITDIHYKGDRPYLEKVVRVINELKPDFTCFTGDLIEEDRHLRESLTILKQLKAPVYGCPGNHDYWAQVEFDDIADAFTETGGAWLVDGRVTTKDGKFTIYGAGADEPRPVTPEPTTKNIALVHYPAWADNLAPGKFDLILAGHTHGGQVRLPFYGPLVLPWGTGNYDLGMFQTGAGPLYVSSGVGWFALNVRLFCRPEIVLFEM